MTDPKKLNRRDFLKYVAAGMGAMAFAPFFQSTDAEEKIASAKSDSGNVILGFSHIAQTARVCITNISVYSKPWDESTILYQKYRDDLMNVYYKVKSEYGPGYNPIWYRVWGGYVHSAHLQMVETRLNEVDYSMNGIALPGKLGEITVPFTQAKMLNNKSWTDVYRLYYQSIHWIVGLATGPDGMPWYRIKDELFDYDSLDYYVPAEHVRLIQDSELTPISVDVPWEEKRIEISLGMQTLTAYEYDKPVMETKCSTGIPSKKVEGKIPTSTPIGEFNIQNKMPSKHMGDGKITSDVEAYELPGVPWDCFFEPKNGVATHGTYWHNNFGMTMSHGCANLPMDKALWVYRWTTPRMETPSVQTIGFGTKVVVS